MKVDFYFDDVEGPFEASFDATLSAPKDFYGRFAKRWLDFAFAVIIAPPTLLLIFALWILVRRDGGGGFFVQKRVGRNGQLFKCYKLRTMVVDAERRLAELIRSDPTVAAEWAEHQKLEDDPRITKIGKFLRSSSLDELPQLFNVVCGDMSFVGPRPIVREELVRYGKFAGTYMSVRPGVTGLWQISGRNDVSYAERVQMDKRYVETLSGVKDVAILLKTVSAVARRTGK